MSSIEKAVERLRGIQGSGQSRGRPEAPTTPIETTIRQSPDDKSSTGSGNGSSRGSSVDSGVGSGAESGVAKVTCHIDLERLERQGFVTPMTDRRASVKELQLLKRPLLKNAFGQGATVVEKGNLVMMTSALPGEGKTFLALNLAMSIALERDLTVLLIDSDVIKPALSNLLGLETESGLTDLLLDANLQVSDVIKSTNIDKLRVVPAGRRYVHSAELLASEEMHRLAGELSERYPNRIVIFDAPPQLATAEAGVLAQWVGQILVVVEEGRTPQRAVKDAISHLDSQKVIGMVLNKSRGGYAHGHYGYGYGYGYGDGYGEQK